MVAMFASSAVDTCVLGVEKDHELGDGQHGQGEPAAPGGGVWLSRCCDGWTRLAAAGDGRHGVSLTWTQVLTPMTMPGGPSRRAGPAVLFTALVRAGTRPGRWSHDNGTARRAA